LATETLTDSSFPDWESNDVILGNWNANQFIILSRFHLTDLQLKRYCVMNSNPPIKVWSNDSDQIGISYFAISALLMT
jgi:hypothetical protein